MRRLAPLLLAVLLLTGCGLGTDVRGVLRERFGAPVASAQGETWRSPDDPARTADLLVGEVEALARRADAGNEYVRFDDDVVVITPDPAGGSTVLAEDLDGRYRTGGFAHLGPGFSPGSPAAGEDDGGPGDAK